MNAPASHQFATRARMPRQLVCMALCCTMGACAFPDVTYSDGGADPPCSVGSNCANKATTCGTQAQNAKGVCEQQNCGGMSCPACTMLFEMDIAACISDCEACGKMDGCLNPTDDCTTLANSP